MKNLVLNVLMFEIFQFHIFSALLRKSFQHYNIHIDNHSIPCQIILAMFTLSHSYPSSLSTNIHFLTINIFLLGATRAKLIKQWKSWYRCEKQPSTSLVFVFKHNRLLLFLLLLFSNRHYLLRMCFLSDNFTRCRT